MSKCVNCGKEFHPWDIYEKFCSEICEKEYQIDNAPRYMTNVNTGAVFSYDEEQFKAKRYMVECDSEGVLLPDQKPEGYIMDSGQMRMGLSVEDQLPGMNDSERLKKLGSKVDNKINKLLTTGVSPKKMLAAGGVEEMKDEKFVNLDNRASVRYIKRRRRKVATRSFRDHCIRQCGKGKNYRTRRIDLNRKSARQERQHLLSSG